MLFIDLHPARSCQKTSTFMLQIAVSDELKLVRLPTHPPEDILNGNKRQLRGGKGNAAHQESIEIYTQLHAKR